MCTTYGRGTAFSSGALSSILIQSARKLMKPTKESFDDAKEEKRSRNSKKGR
jgi:hypothetical protein